MRHLPRPAPPAGLLLAALALAGLSSPCRAQAAVLPAIDGSALRMPVTSLRQVRLSHTVRQQYDFSCGSAAVATLLTHHYGYPITEAEVFEQMFQDGDQERIRREGFSLLDMKRFLASRGFEADGFQLPLDKLADQQTPAIVLLNERGYMHFVVVKGMRGDRVLLGDPANGTRSISRAAFEAAWPSQLLFVIHSHLRTARFNQAADWRVSPDAPLTTAISRESLQGITLPKNGPGDF
ncbi:MAG TPA: C39 family peptidase [Aquabacterium sp.]|nr:C39 family peptidase [Aquabacterium sp.]